ncbi:MAG: hypothetical protein KDC53_14000 [Saprospiraceae bacterium]|nr:hypothetical protein [Saprospiraceae bacterium]
MFRRWLFLIFLSLMLAECKDGLEDPLSDTQLGYEYYPLEVGKYRIYQVDSIQFDLGMGDLPVSDTSRFFLRENTVEIIPDLEGHDRYRIERSRSADPEGPWAPLDVITRDRNERQAGSTENNIRLINLVFPPTKDLSWNGTSYINDQITVFVKGETIEMYRDWDFRILSVDVNEQIGQYNFEDVVTVQQSDSENPFEKRYSIEKFAKGVGLIFKEQQIVDSYCKYVGDNAHCVGLDWNLKSGRGYFLTFHLVDYN